MIRRMASRLARSMCALVGALDQLV